MMLNLITKIYDKARNYEYDVVHKIITDIDNIKSCLDKNNYPIEIRKLKIICGELGNELIYFSELGKEKLLTNIVLLFCSVLMKNINLNITGDQLKDMFQIFNLSNRIVKRDIILDPYNIYQYIKSFNLGNKKITLNQVSKCLLVLGKYSVHKQDISFIQLINNGIENINKYSKYDLCILLSQLLEYKNNYRYKPNFSIIKKSLFENWNEVNKNLQVIILKEILYQLKIIKNTYVIHYKLEKSYISDVHYNSNRNESVGNNNGTSDKSKDIDPMIFTLINNLIDELYRSNGESSAATPILNFDGIIEVMDKDIDKYTDKYQVKMNDILNIIHKYGWRSKLRYKNKFGFSSPPDIQNIIKELCEEIGRKYEPSVINEQVEIQKYYSMSILEDKQKNIEYDNDHLKYDYNDYIEYDYIEYDENEYDEYDKFTVIELLDILINDIEYIPKKSIKSFITNADKLENKGLYYTVVECLEEYELEDNLNIEEILYSLNKIKNDQ